MPRHNTRRCPLILARKVYRCILRHALWLTADRAVAASRILLAILVGLFASIPWTVPTMRVGWDFAAFWTASRLALAGRASDAYGDPERAALAALLGPGDYPPFFYPPIALLFWLPFAIMPFAIAATLWMACSGAAFASAVRATFGSRFVIPALSCPSVLFCALYGQNSLLSAALLCGAAAALDRLPVLAGIFLGLLAFKPQLALLAHLALVVAGRWCALVSAAATATILGLLSVAAFGTRSWVAFAASIPAAKTFNADGVPGFDKFISSYAAIRLLGWPESMAWTVQAVTALVASALLIAAARKRPGGGGEISLIIVATGFCVPFFGEYEFVIFVVPAAWLASQAIQTGWLPFERLTLGLIYFAPLAIKSATAHGVPLAPIAVLATTVLTLRRAFRHVVDPNSSASGVSAR